jgi:hypothetical protein
MTRVSHTQTRRNHEHRSQHLRRCQSPVAAVDPPPGAGLSQNGKVYRVRPVSRVVCRGRREAPLNDCEGFVGQMVGRRAKACAGTGQSATCPYPWFAVTRSDGLSRNTWSRRS